MERRIRLVVLAGDGIGPLVIDSALTVLEALRDLLPWSVQVSRLPFGRAALESEGDMAPSWVLAEASAADAVLLGAVDTIGSGSQTMGTQQSAVLRLRRHLGCYANLRPVRPPGGDRAAPPGNGQPGPRIDLLFVRELSSGIYYGQPKEITGERGSRVAVDTCRYTEQEIVRVATVAFQAAKARRRRLTSVDKANVMCTSQLWRQVVSEVAGAYPDVECDHMLVDSFAFRLLTDPARFDVVLTENLFGDILTDEAAALVGSLGAMPSASVGVESGPGIYEPVHGSAPDLVGTDSANPIGAILSLAMLLGDQGAMAVKASIEAAVDEVAAVGLLTSDMGGTGTTAMVTKAITSRLG